MKLEFFPHQARDARRVIEMAAYHSIEVTRVQLATTDLGATVSVAAVDPAAPADVEFLSARRLSEAEIADVYKVPISEARLSTANIASEAIPESAEAITRANAEDGETPAPQSESAARPEGEPVNENAENLEA